MLTLCKSTGVKNEYLIRPSVIIIQCIQFYYTNNNNNKTIFSILTNFLAHRLKTLVLTILFSSTSLVQTTVISIVRHTCYTNFEMSNKPYYMTICTHVTHTNTYTHTSNSHSLTKSTSVILRPLSTYKYTVDVHCASIVRYAP